MIHLEQFVYTRPNLLALMAHVGRFVYPSRQTHEINIRLIKSKHIKKTGQAQRVSGGRESHISRHSAYDGQSC